MFPIAEVRVEDSSCANLFRSDTLEDKNLGAFEVCAVWVVHLDNEELPAFLRPLYSEITRVRVRERGRSCVLIQAAGTCRAARAEKAYCTHRDLLRTSLRKDIASLGSIYNVTNCHYEVTRE